MTLATSALVVNLQIGVAGGAPKAVIAAGVAVRNHFYVNTLAWKGNGDRLLPCKNFTTFMGGHLALKKEFATLIDDKAHWSRITDNNDLDNKFYVRLDVDQVPLPVDFCAELEERIFAAIVGKLYAAEHKRTVRATEDLWSRLIDPLTHFADIMENGKAFRDATVKNLVEAVELMPRLNFANDGGIIEVLERVRALGVDIKALRKDGVYRAAKAEVARDILTEIERVRG